MTDTATPRLRIESACNRLGTDEVIRRCESLFTHGASDPDFLLILGGAPARRFLGDAVSSDQDYWLRVWALRGLLWAGSPENQHVIEDALRDEHWRVREMACKVVARHELGDHLDVVADLESDTTARVRTAATTAARRLLGAQA